MGLTLTLTGQPYCVCVCVQYTTRPFVSWFPDFDTENQCNDHRSSTSAAIVDGYIASYKTNHVIASRFGSTRGSGLVGWCASA